MIVTCCLAATKIQNNSHSYNFLSIFLIPNSRDISKLKANWVEDTQIVYIGMTQDTLKKRLSTYMRFGQGEAVGLPRLDHLLETYAHR